MRPPLAGRREAVRRLAGKVLGAKPRVSASAPDAVEEGDAAVGPAAPLGAADAAARIDAARDRLRATIEPPDAERD